MLGDAQAVKRDRGEAVTSAEQAEQNVLGSHVVVAEAAHLVPGRGYRGLRICGEMLEPGGRVRSYTNVRRYAGGLSDWTAAGLPLDSDHADPSRAAST